MRRRVDFDGDGRDDLFWYRPGTGSDPIWWGQASRSAFGSANQTTENVNGTYDVTAGNIDGDSNDRDDLVFEHDTSSTDIVWWGTAPAGFGNDQNTYSFPASVTVHAGDFDGDGHSDVFFYDENGTNDTIWWGDARSDFGTDVGIDTVSQTTSTSSYDTDGLRSSKTVDGATAQDFTWDTSSGLPLLLAETQGSTVTRIIYGPGGQPVAEITDDGSTETSRWLHHDQLGSVRLTTDATDGTTASSRTFTPYGEVADQSGDQPLLGYAGQYTDPETGYQYLPARYYDPTTAQFLTRDPIAATTEEPYGYARANPSAGSDPSGLFCVGDLCTPDCPFGETDSGGCNGAGIARNPVVQTVAVVAACSTGVGCAAANIAVVAINAQDRWDGSQGVVDNLTDPGFVAGTALDAAIARFNLRTLPAYKGYTVAYGPGPQGLIRQASPIGSGGRLPLDMAMARVWLPNTGIVGGGSLLSYLFNKWAC